MQGAARELLTCPRVPALRTYRDWRAGLNFGNVCGTLAFPPIWPGDPSPRCETFKPAVRYRRKSWARNVHDGLCGAVICGRRFARSAVAARAIGCLFAGANPTRPAAAETEAPACVVPKDLVRLELPLKRTARHLASRKLTLIVVLGSSSTAGVGASSAESAYPSRLMVGLAQRFPTQPLMVLDRGISWRTCCRRAGRLR